MLVTLPAANIQEKHGRVCGHRFTPASREELKKLQQLAPRLRELGVTRIICSDLDGQSGAALGRRLNVPVEEWQSLRRFNYGKLHGTDVVKANIIRSAIEDETVPVRGGDSRASFEKRRAAAEARLATMPETTLVLIERPDMIRYRIYEINFDEVTFAPSTTNAAQAVGAATA